MCLACEDIGKLISLNPTHESSSFILEASSKTGQMSSAHKYSISEPLSRQFLLDFIESVNGDAHDESLG